MSSTVDYSRISRTGAPGLGDRRRSRSHRTARLIAIVSSMCPASYRVRCSRSFEPTAMRDPLISSTPRRTRTGGEDSRSHPRHIQARVLSASVPLVHPAARSTAPRARAPRAHWSDGHGIYRMLTFRDERLLCGARATHARPPDPRASSGDDRSPLRACADGPRRVRSR